MRTFIALELPSHIGQQLEEISNSLQAFLHKQNAPRRLRWSSQSNAHLTLRFLGDTSQTQADKLSTRLQAIITKEQSFELSLGELGCYPNRRRPRVVWVGLQGELSCLQTLQAAIEDAAQQAGFEPEKRPYSPHITLARVRRGTSSRQLKLISQSLQGTRSGNQPPKLEDNTLPFKVNEVVYMKSELRPSGAIHERLQQYRLTSK